MEFFKAKTNINFMGLRKFNAWLSVAFVVFSVVAVSTKGLNLGLDFTGGTQLEVVFSGPVELDSVRDVIEAEGIGKSDLKRFGRADTLLIVVPNSDMDNKVLTKKMTQALIKLDPGSKVTRSDYIGPQVGKELIDKGIMAVAVSILFMMVYILLRFEYRLALSAALALMHDPILILGIFSLFQIEFNLVVLGAVLAVLGYSINDTIVVFDRVRENFKKHRKLGVSKIMNLSINETLSRTIMTSGSTLIVVLALLFLGGEDLKGFSLVLTIGIIVGTYSSIYIAGALAVTMGLTRKDLIKEKRERLDDMP